MPTLPRLSTPIVLVLLAIALMGLGIDLTDGYWPKTFSSGMIVLGLVALFMSRQYKSSRWRLVMMIAFTLAVAALLGRFAVWQDWV